MRAIRAFVTACLATGVLVASSAVTTQAQGAKMSWDIVHLDSESRTLSPGGVAAAGANDGSSIVLTGSGTVGPSASDPVTGGGQWTTFALSGAITGTGAYRVTGLVSFVEAPGTVPPAVTDQIGEKEDARSGLAVLRIQYDDGETGVLTVSCHLPVGAPDAIFEGITATKGAVQFWDRVPPVAGVDANRTTFHVVP